MTIEKAVLISEGPADVVASHVASLDLPRRACSIPVAPASEDLMPSFVELWAEPESLRAAVAIWPLPVRAWLVAEHVPIAYERAWASGEASPGVRMISTVHRRDGMSPVDFEAYWLGPHTAVAKSYTVAVWNYNQDIVIESLTPGDPLEVDGFVGMHFRTAEEMRARWQDHPTEAARGSRDAAQFMAVDRSVSITAVETVWESAVRG